MTFSPWQIWRRVSGEPSRVVATVKARSAKEALTRYARQKGFRNNDEMQNQWVPMTRREDGKIVPYEYVALPADACTHCGRPRDECRRETLERLQCKLDDGKD